jgi:hypothetical protein
MNIFDLACDIFAARVATTFEDLVNSTLIYTEGRRYGVLVFTVPMANPYLGRIVVGEFI